jgi:radical SAM protein with 4Fe4S-binding SPASM domain
MVTGGAVSGRDVRGRHLHLRPEKDRALLIVDGVRVIVLNREAAAITDLLLRGHDASSAEREILGMAGRADRQVVRDDVRALETMLDRLAAGEEPCRALPAFSVVDCDEVLHPSAPFRADLALTYACPNDCRHCYSASQPRIPELEPARWEAIIRRLADAGIPYVCFTGGEPTTYDGLPRLVRFASDLGLVTGVLTCGRRLSQRSYAEALAAEGLDYIQVTLESCDEDVHDRMVGRRAWGETVGGIRNAVGLGLAVVTNTTLTPATMETAADTAAFCASLGVSTVAANALIPTGRARDAGMAAVGAGRLFGVIEQMAQEAREGGARFMWYSPTPWCLFNPMALDLGAKHCSAASGSVAVDPSGMAQPCQSFFVPAGDVLATPWDEIWNGPLFSRVRAWRSKRFACGDCPDGDICRGGCPLEERLDVDLAMPAARGRLEGTHDLARP